MNGGSRRGQQRVPNIKQLPNWSRGRKFLGEDLSSEIDAQMMHHMVLISRVRNWIKADFNFRKML